MSTYHPSNHSLEFKSFASETMVNAEVDFSFKATTGYLALAATNLLTLTVKKDLCDD